MNRHPSKIPCHRLLVTSSCHKFELWDNTASVKRFTYGRNIWCVPPASVFKCVCRDAVLDCLSIKPAEVLFQKLNNCGVRRFVFSINAVLLLFLTILFSFSGILFLGGFVVLNPNALWKKSFFFFISTNRKDETAGRELSLCNLKAAALMPWVTTRPLGSG